MLVSKRLDVGIYMWHIGLNLAGPRRKPQMAQYRVVMRVSAWDPFPHLGFGRAWDLPRWADPTLRGALPMRQLGKACVVFVVHLMLCVRLGWVCFGAA